MCKDGLDGWASSEFSDVDLGDKRLKDRLIKMCDRFSESPESPINQACEDWAETKAAYRFFKNECVDPAKILEAHASKTAERAKKEKVILAVQDTSYLIYTSHKKTTGLGRLSMKKGKHVAEINSNGLVMHSSLALTTEGLPLGLLHQKIFPRISRTPEQKKLQDKTPIEEKESFRWLESLKESKAKVGDTKIVTVCDREADIYEFFQLGEKIDAPLLVRANVNRDVNKKSRFAEVNTEKLWDFMLRQPVAATYNVNVAPHEKRIARIAQMELRFAPFAFNPPINNVKHRQSKLPDLEMHAVYVRETSTPPEGEDPLEWMLLTNMSVSNPEEAMEKVIWYALRWRIEMYHKVLKSGFHIEDCRLSEANRLIKYLTIMSIVAWRIFMITLVARTSPDMPCSGFLSTTEWQVLHARMNRGKELPKHPPSMQKVIRWIAQLGGFLGRKHDGEPGTIVLWRGWKRLADLVVGWSLALER